MQNHRWRSWTVCLFLLGILQGNCVAIARPLQSLHQESIQTLQAKIRQQPQDEDNYLKLGELLVAQNQIAAALQIYRASLPYTLPDEQDPQEKEAQVYTDLGDAFMKLRRFPEALQIRQKVVQLQPQDPEFREYLADALAVAGQTEAAIASYIQASQMELAQGESGKPVSTSGKNNMSFEAIAYESLGNTFLRYGKAEEAIVAYRTAIKLEPDYREFYTGIANALVAHHQIPEAEASFLKAESMNPEPSKLSKAAVVQVAVAKALLEQDRVQEAIAVLEKAQRLEPQSKEIQEQLKGAKESLFQNASN